MDSFVKKVPDPILERSHAHNEADYETVDSVTKVCELFRLDGNGLGVGLVVVGEEGH